MLRAACEVVIPSCTEIKTEHYILTYYMELHVAQDECKCPWHSFERGMLLMWHISGFMNVIIGSRLASER